MGKDTRTDGSGQAQFVQHLDELVRSGARQMIEQAVHAELQQLLERYENVRLLDGRRSLVRNGYLPERQVLTAAGSVAVRVPKVRDRSGQGIKFNSRVVPPYVRRSRRVAAALPWLYLKGISTGEMKEALQVLLGEDACGLSPAVISRLKADWAQEYERWSRRDLSARRYVYWWADGVHTNLRGDSIDHQCLLTIIGVLPDGSKELVAIADGIRESTQSWRELLLDLKERGLKAGSRPTSMILNKSRNSRSSSLDQPMSHLAYTRFDYSSADRSSLAVASIAIELTFGCQPHPVAQAGLGDAQHLRHLRLGLTSMDLAHRLQLEFLRVPCTHLFVIHLSTPCQDCLQELRTPLLGDKVICHSMCSMDETEAMEMVVKSMKATKNNSQFFDAMRRGG